MAIRRRKTLIKEVTKLDAFPKISEECMVKSPTRGTVSILCFIWIAFLIVGEVSHFLTTKFVFKFTPDTDFKSKIRINIDITVATPCKAIGADILDDSKRQVPMTDIEVNDVIWELDEKQQAHFQSMSDLNANLRENMHSFHDMIWKTRYVFHPTPRKMIDNVTRSEACRFTGSATINKVAGTFHILFGVPVMIPGGHAHVQFLNSPTGAQHPMNFSHRIDRLSFGEIVGGVVQPLEGDLVIAESDKMCYKYFLTVVPTDINMYGFKGSTFQYSVTELAREVDHDKGSHGMPGIYFRYDLSALRITVTETHSETLVKFLVRVAAITGGVLTISGLLSSLTELVTSYLWGKFSSKVESPSSSSSLYNPQIDTTKSANDLLQPLLQETLRKPENGNALLSGGQSAVSIVNAEQLKSNSLLSTPKDGQQSDRGHL